MKFTTSFLFKVCFLSVFIFSLATSTNPSTGSGTESESGNKKSKGEAFGEAFTSAAGVVGDPRVQAAIETLKAFKTESSTSIGERYDPAGFEFIHNVIVHGTGATYSYNLDKLVALWLEDDAFKGVEETYKKVVSLAMREYALQVSSEPYLNQKFDLSYNNGQGSLFLMTVALVPHHEHKNVFLWERYLLVSSFRPSKPYVIVTHSDCDILSCDRTDQIVYLEASITDAHIRSIIDLNINFLGRFNQLAISQQQNNQLRIK